MSSDRISIRISTSLSRRLQKTSAMKGKSESEVIREALENYLGRASEEQSAYGMAEVAGLIGCVQRRPKDLSTNPRYFDGFGKE